MRAVMRLVGPNPASIFGSSLIGLGLLLLLYAVGMYADLLPGSRVSVPRPPALDRPRAATVLVPAQEADLAASEVAIAEPTRAEGTDRSRGSASVVAGGLAPDAMATLGPLPSDPTGAAIGATPEPTIEQAFSILVAEVARGSDTASRSEVESLPSATPSSPAAEIDRQTDQTAQVAQTADAVRVPAEANAESMSPDAADRLDLGVRPPPAQAVRLQIPAIKLETEVVAGGIVVNQDGETEWETVPFVAAHYVQTALVGAPGNAVIAGHVITRQEGNVFRNLYLLDFGNTVEVETESGRFTYEVADLKLVEPTAVEVLAPTDDPTLTLVTCGGEFNPRTRQFSHRLIVVAKLVDWAKAPAA